MVTLLLPFFLLIASLVLFILAFLWTRRRPIGLRPIVGYERLRQCIRQAAESGRPVHLSPGIASLGGTASAESFAGLTVAVYLAQQAAQYQTPFQISAADPFMFLATRGQQQRASLAIGAAPYQRDDQRYIAPAQTGPLVEGIASYTSSASGVFLPGVAAPTPLSAPVVATDLGAILPALPAFGQAAASAAYASGVMSSLRRTRPLVTVMIGWFGDEYLLMGETAAQQNIIQVSGTTNPAVLPFMLATSAEGTLLGEEIFAAGAYLQERPSHIASLLAQDWARLLIVAIIVLGALGAALFGKV